MSRIVNGGRAAFPLVLLLSIAKFTDDGRPESFKTEFHSEVSEMYHQLRPHSLLGLSPAASHAIDVDTSVERRPKNDDTHTHLACIPSFSHTCLYARTQVYVGYTNTLQTTAYLYVVNVTQAVARIARFIDVMYLYYKCTVYVQVWQIF